MIIIFIMPQRKYTDQQLIDAIKSSSSQKEVAIKIGLSPNGGNNFPLKYALSLDIDGSLTKRIESWKLMPKTHSQETKKMLSDKRKKYLSENKYKHNWSMYHGKETYPETEFKRVLCDLGASITQYYIPPENDRFFELDFCIPDLKIAWEINGNQHYESDYTTLKPYYQERHDYFVAKGWRIYEINYAEAYVPGRYESIIKESMSNLNYEYFQSGEIINWREKRKLDKEIQNNRIKRKYEVNGLKFKEKEPYKVRSFIMKNDKKLQKYIGVNLNKYSRILSLPLNSRFYFYLENSQEFRDLGKSASRYNSRKVVRPTKDQLMKLVWEKPTQQLAKDFGVSDKAIDKWCKSYNLSKPPRGYWAKKAYGKL